MPKFRAPGVYVRELSVRARNIEGAPGAEAGFVGMAMRGPAQGPPTLVESFTAFERVFGGLDPLQTGGKPRPAYLAHAAKAFFDNGGRRLHVVRVLAGKAGPQAHVASAADLAGSGAGSPQATGLAALEAVREVSIVALPDAGALGDAQACADAGQALIDHCERMGDRFALVDGPAASTIASIATFRARFDSSRAALQHPWVLVDAPRGTSLEVPPSGAVAGVYARSALTNGVHAAAAGQELRGIRGLAAAITQAENQTLNQAGINALRSFPKRGHRLWGARSMSSDPEWKYVHVRRYVDHLESSIERSTAWVVFEPNAEPLWAKLRQAIGSFLSSEWRAGALQGSKQEQAYFVRCDRTTMTQADIDQGRVLCELGVALVRPAEFVILRLGWTSAEAPI